MVRPFPNSQKVYRNGSRQDIRVPFRQIQLSGHLGNVQVYDTSGPFTDPEVPINLNHGLPPLRKNWVEGRKIKPGNNVTQMHFAKKGIVTEEMEFVAIRENVSPEFVREEVARGRAIIPDPSRSTGNQRP